MKKILFQTIAVFFAIVFSGYAALSQDLQSARNLTNSERFEEASTAFKTLIQKENKNADAYFYYAENFLKQYLSDTFAISKTEVIQDIVELYKKGIAADSTNALNYVGLGIVELLRRGDTAKADIFFNKANGLVPVKAKKCLPKDIVVLTKLGTAQIYGKNKRHAKGLAYIDRAKEAALDKDPEVYLAAGDIYLDKKDGSNAITNYNKALYIDPKSALSQIKIGYIYLSAKNLNESRRFFEKAKEVDSTFAPVYRGLGEVFTAARLYKFAKENYRKFLTLSGDNTPAKVSYIGSLFKSGEYDEALVLIEEVLAVDNSRNYLNRIGAYSSYDRRVEKGVDKTPDYEKGLAYIETFFKNTTPEKVILKDYTYYGKLLIKLQKKDSTYLDKGIDNLIKAYEMDTTDSDILNEVIKACYYNKRYERAVEVINKKIANGGSDVSDYMMLGKAFYQMKSYKNADSIFTKVSEKDPSNVESYVWQANAAASMDPDSKDGLAKPKFELVIQKAMVDTVKYQNDILNAYSYLASYNLKVKKDNDQTKYYANKILALNPENKDIQTKGYSFLSAVYIGVKDYNKVKQIYNKLLEIEPNNSDYKKMIEWANKGIESQKDKNGGN